MRYIVKEVEEPLMYLNVEDMHEVKTIDNVLHVSLWAEDSTFGRCHSKIMVVTVLGIKNLCFEFWRTSFNVVGQRTKQFKSLACMMVDS